jgi:hypothetical protein
MSIRDLAPALVAGGAMLASILGVLKFFEDRREKRAILREAFASVVKSLSSEDNDVRRLAAAILLRRFFDARTEVGRGHTPFAQEAVSVMASLLRSQGTGTFQKLLADGLAYAPTLVRADLQKTNLQNAYLGAREVGSDKKAKLVRVDLSYADFYRADLSNASLKAAKASNAQFYQARLQGTVFKGADLRDANFYGADLRGAKLDNALLKGANFRDARNLPPGIFHALDEEGRYGSDDAFKPTEEPRGVGETIRVFISRPGVLLDHHQQSLVAVTRRLETEGMLPEMLERKDYPEFGTIAEVQRLMAGCSGALVLGLREIEVRDGLWRAGTADQQRLCGVTYATPWSQIEAGMAVMRGLPVLILTEPGVEGGVFDTAKEHNIFRLRTDDDLASSVFAHWSAAVRERANSV